MFPESEVFIMKVDSLFGTESGRSVYREVCLIGPESGTFD